MKSNVYRAIFFETPDYIPVRFSINDACWHHYPQDWLAQQINDHQLVFSGRKPPELPYTPIYALVARKEKPYVDDFGCRWETTDNGITGTVVDHPLSDWAAYGKYIFPDPEHQTGIGPVDWAAETARIQTEHDTGEFSIRGLRHGHTFLQLCYLRGYQNLMYDMVDEEPLLMDLIKQLELFNQNIVDRYLDAGADMISFPEDLGMQVGPMISPELFRRYIKPSYIRMMRSVKEKGLPVHMHSDGDIRMLADDLVDSGVAVINLQDLVNGVDWIRERFRERLCVDLDVDRQHVTVNGTPKEIDELIRREVEAIATPRGGLMLTFGLYPGTPMKNVEAIINALERYMQFF